MVPDGLIAEPQTDADILHNSVAYEFGMYDWQTYADGLEGYIDDLKEALGGGTM